MTEPIRLLIVDDHTLLRESLCALMEAQQDVVVVGQAANGMEALELFAQRKPDVTLLDLVMPEMDGIAAIGELVKLNAEAHILVLTSFADDEKVFAALKAGALGYLLKDASAEDLLQSIREVHKGNSSLHPAIARRVLQDLRQPAAAANPEGALSDREWEVLDLIAKGSSNLQIAEKLVISERTVHSHVRNILRKLHFANRTQAAVYAQQHRAEKQK